MVLDLILKFLTQYGLITLLITSFVSNFLLFPAFVEISSVLFLSLNFSPFSIFFSIVLGSVVGGVLSYFLGYFGSSSFSKYEKRIWEIEKLIKRWGSYSVFLVSFLPMPFPFALFGMLMGFLKMDIKKFVLFILAGKSLRAGIVLFLLSLGPQVLKFM